MDVGLWRVGPRWTIVAVLAVLGLAAAACSSDAGSSVDEETVATIIGGTTARSAEEPAVSITALAVTDPSTSTATQTTATTTQDLTPTTVSATTATSTVPTETLPATSVPTTGAPTAGADRVVGTGTAASCTSAAVVAAVAAGGVITFDCGSAPVTIAMNETAKVVNANGPEVVLDGGGSVTLSGQGVRRILYMNTCDQAQGWTTSHCQNQDHPRLTVRNIAFSNGNATGQTAEGGGGGAIFVRGGRLRVENATFIGNRCDDTGPDVGGAAIRVLSQYQGLPVSVSGSTFRDGVCSNGGALSSIGVSWTITDTVMTNNRAIGRGANPAKAGTPGGGSGGAIYLDGNTFTLDLQRSRIEGNRANEGGGAVFFVSNDRSGRLSISGSQLIANPSDGFETDGYPGIFFLGAGTPSVSGSTLTD